MMKQMYKIGEFAEKLGVSVGFLKHHEKYGLLEPYTTEAGHRYYTDDQAIQVYRCLTLQAMGFSVKESAEILQTVNEIDIAALFRSKLEARRRELLKLELSVSYLEVLTSRGIGDPNIPRWRLSNDFNEYYLEFSRNGELTGGDELSQIFSNWMNYFPMVSIAYRIDVDDSPEHRVVDIGVGLIFPKEMLKDMPGIDTSKAVELRFGRVIDYLVFKEIPDFSWDSPEYARELIQEPLDFLNAHNFTVPGRIMAISGFSSAMYNQKKTDACVILPIVE